MGGCLFLRGRGVAFVHAIKKKIKGKSII